MAQTLYPESKHEADGTFCYTFTVYQEEEKFHTDYYTLEGAKEMASLMKANKEAFTCSKDVGNDTLEEVKERWAY